MNAKSVRLSALLKRAVVDGQTEALGRVQDLVVGLRPDDNPAVVGIVLRIRGARVFVPASRIVSMDTKRVQLQDAKLDMRPFARRSGEVLLRGDILGHRLIEVSSATLVRAHDVELSEVNGEWVVTGVDVHRRPMFRFGSDQAHPVHDWRAFEALIGHAATAEERSAGGRIKDFKAAQIADLIESASPEEQHELLATVHTDPELEADVFEELEDDQQAQILRNRPDAEVAEIITKMRADDAADAIMELQQERRLTVLALLEEPQRGRVRTLLGYADATAGGLMGVEYVTCPKSGTVADALAAVRTAPAKQPEALTAIFLTETDGGLGGVVSLTDAVQAEPNAPLVEVGDLDPIHTHPDNDLVDAVRLMADFNIIVLPVIERGTHRMVGVITVDDALEAAMPEQWRKREVEQHRLHA